MYDGPMARVPPRERRVPSAVPHGVITLMRAADQARRQMVAALQPYDVTLQQANVLIILRRAGAEGVPTLQVADRLVEQTPGITRLVNALAAKKYIRRRRCRDDARQQLCYLTEKGARLLGRLLPALDASCARILRPLDGPELESLTTSLAKIAGTETPGS